jgi:hypothetical protein
MTNKSASLPAELTALHPGYALIDSAALVQGR